MKHVTICITTINKPHFIEDLILNANKYNYKDFNIIIIGDYKSPKNNHEYINYIRKKLNADIRYLTVKDQILFLKKNKSLSKILPYNWGGRKMLANYISILEKSPVTVQIDDDNFILNNNFFHHHSEVGDIKRIPLFSSENKWFNIYKSLNESKNLPIYPRGFLQKYRFKKNKIKKENKLIKIATCNGLVLNDPDIDAFTRLNWPVKVTSVKKKYLPKFGLKPNTWCTWNNQNTSTYHEVTKIYFTPASVGRNSDIWTSMVICKIASHLNEAVSFGQPLVRQDRNFHNIMKDYDDEKYCNIHNEDFEKILRSIKLEQNSYIYCLIELINKFLKHLRKKKNEKYYSFIKKYLNEYKIWAEIIYSIK